MKRTRVTSAVLLATAVLTLAACSDDDKTEAGSATPAAPASATAAPSASAIVTDPTATKDGPGSKAGAAADKELCTATDKAGQSMKKALVTLMSANSGTISAGDAKAILEDFTKQVTTALQSAGDSKVSAAAKAVADEAAKAATAADPVTAAAEPSFEKAGTDVAAACRAAGVPVSF
ncbi:hypothetical protein [Actinoplanes teichomyceticus]|uniref:Uncharacterized protein n=1 Tax=Actinoplanes teichomyceticus TaxID=1867 RepID=A0A561WAL2_ACTTI|nr:hypothetical protein [Actinoplanes teichomyceticus]TWG20904.1 hypothetical protein FHX34_103433 [Actinoplanes teichomyceticus]GIF16490.1 hypothetical protein Ate01nite_65220 [Actinoplanes teichomyceticus]